MQVCQGGWEARIRDIDGLCLFDIFGVLGFFLEIENSNASHINIYVLYFQTFQRKVF